MEFIARSHARCVSAQVDFEKREKRKKRKKKKKKKRKAEEDKDSDREISKARGTQDVIFPSSIDKNAFRDPKHPRECLKFPNLSENK